MSVTGMHAGLRCEFSVYDARKGFSPGSILLDRLIEYADKEGFG
jgi:hypothetical protein